MMEEKVKVFLSWSGELSHKVAAAFAKWLPDVIQSVDTYLSSDDIDKGAAWYSEITENLQESAIGVIFLTKDNINRPWVYFESGAIAGKFERNRVCPLLIGIDESDIKDTPLFNHMCTKYEKEEIRKLVQSINKAKKEGLILDENRLERAFDKCWDDLNDKVAQIVEEYKSNDDESIRNEKELAIAEKQPELQEILERVKYMHRILSDPEALFIEPLRDVIRSYTPRITGTPLVYDAEHLALLPKWSDLVLNLSDYWGKKVEHDKAFHQENNDSPSFEGNDEEEEKQ